MALSSVLLCIDQHAAWFFLFYPVKPNESSDHGLAGARPHFQKIQTILCINYHEALQVKHAT